ncbi:hypothetical protein [Virgibacillus senegalensis]|uniref:hypothetical protein n=1 Tax=Virgibacillus senegalensis TaxID=1499679 RepID=UPI00069E8E90|nr:hypothetical protein [Virgibacillus senegalensis]
MSFSLSKKKFFSILSLLSLFAMVFMFSTSSVTAASSPDTKVEDITPDNPEEFIKEMGWEKPTPDAKLIKVVRVSSEKADKEVEANEKIVQPQGLYYNIKNVRNIGQLCGTSVQARTSGTGGADGVLTLKQTASVSNSYSANVGVSSGTISGGVGFDVTKSMSRETSYAVNTHGNDYQIVAYDDYQGKSFDVYNIFGSKAGSGTALRQVGFCYSAYEI